MAKFFGQTRTPQRLPNNESRALTAIRTTDAVQSISTVINVTSALVAVSDVSTNSVLKTVFETSSNKDAEFLPSDIIEKTLALEEAEHVVVQSEHVDTKSSMQSTPALMVESVTESVNGKKSGRKRKNKF